MWQSSNLLAGKGLCGRCVYGCGNGFVFVCSLMASVFAISFPMMRANVSSYFVYVDFVLGPIIFGVQCYYK